MPNCPLDNTILTNIETNFPWKNYYCSACRSTFIETNNNLLPVSPLVALEQSGSDYKTKISGYNVPRTATYVVAASNAPVHVKAQADYVCDGVADNVQIQAAIDALPAWGGSIELSSGYFYLSDSISPNKRVNIQGQGKYSTIIYMASGANIDLFKLAAGTQDSFGLSHLALDGNKANNLTAGSGIIGTRIGGVNLNDVVIQSFREYGIYRAIGAMYSWRLYSVIIAACEKDDFYWSGDGSIWIDSCYFLTSGERAAVILSANDIWITNSSFDQSTKDQVAIISCGNIWLIGNYFGAGVTAEYNGLLLSTLINNLYMVGNKAFQNTGNGFYLSGTFNDAVITGNEAYNNSQWGWRFPGMVATNVIIQNNISRLNTSGNWSTAELGTGATYFKNLGLTTENSGTATVLNATTSIKVTHGLVAVPTRVQITPTLLSAVTHWWISSKDSDMDGLKFTITVDQDPGVGTAIFDWKAQVGEG